MTSACAASRRALAMLIASPCEPAWMIGMPFTSVVPVGCRCPATIRSTLAESSSRAIERISPLQPLSLQDHPA